MWWSKKKNEVKKVLKAEVLYISVHSKYQVGQSVIMLANQTIAEVEIKSVQIVLSEGHKDIRYETVDSPYGSGMNTYGFHEHEIYKDREELAKAIVEGKCGG